MNFPKLINDRRGFTLVEMMIAVAISGLIATALIAAYRVQQKTYGVQQTVVQMQQNLRAVSQMMAYEIRLAGYDPTLSGVGGFVAATNNTIRFSRDENGDGDVSDTGENITYSLSSPLLDGSRTIVRTYNSTVGSVTLPVAQPVAEDIEAIDFIYTIIDPSTGDLTQVSNPTTTGNLKNIRSVQVAILARSANRDNKFFNTFTYTMHQAVDAVLVLNLTFNDNFRRRLLVSTVNCRNMGI